MGQLLSLFLASLILFVGSHLIGRAFNPAAKINRAETRESHFFSDLTTSKDNGLNSLNPD
jgi:hypothetical protein